MEHKFRGNKDTHIRRQHDDWDDVHNQLLDVQQKNAVQGKSLDVSEPGDADEKEADEVARKVMGGEPATIHGDGGTINRKGDGATKTTADFQTKLQGSKGSGDPLPEDVQQEMGSKMGTDFSNVKVHSGSEAGNMSESINAKAFAHGQDIYFGKGNYNPQSSAGKELLAHELVHTVQQGEGKVQPKIQRTESDTRIGATNLVDCAGDINTMVNSAIAASKAVAPPEDNISDFLFELYGRLAARADTGYNTKVEAFIDTLPETKRYKPKLSDTKYADADRNMKGENTGGKWESDTDSMLSPTINVNGTLIGSDKLGLFFMQGWEHYDAADPEQKAKETEDNEFFDSGVYSNADILATVSGSAFVNDLKKDTSVPFDIAKYITADWNEVVNPNVYTPKLGKTVWKNLVDKATAGTVVDVFDEENKVVPMKVFLSTTADDVVKGTISYTNAKGDVVMNISGGKMKYLMGKVGEHDVITGIEIETDWNANGKKGKIKLKSDKEKQLVGPVHTGNFDSAILGQMTIDL
ncbi:MAG TPA: DUF4157 domain-containing protein [Bacteroidia bacterium]|nr:DUF4157 domain-containing protein [Bacteroidia bacterium]